MGRFTSGLFVLSAGLALASANSRAHACCGLDTEADACREAAIRAELAELAPPLKLAFSFSNDVCEAAALEGEECSCDGQCHCSSMTHRLHEDVVLAELDASHKAVSADGASNPAASPAPFVDLAFAFSRGDSQRMHADRVERELAEHEQPAGHFANPHLQPRGVTVAFSFAADPLPGQIVNHFWNVDVSPRPAFKGAAFERIVVDLKKREHEIAAEFAAAAAFAMESGADATLADNPATERGASAQCSAETQFPLNEAQAFDNALLIEEQLVHPQTSKECLLCEWSIDAPSTEAQPLKQFYEVEWETPPSMPIYPAPPHVPNLIPSNHLAARRPARIHVSIEGAAMRFRDEGGALPVYR